MPNWYPQFRRDSQKCTQGTPLVKARNSKKMKMLNLKFAWISDPACQYYANSCEVQVGDGRVSFEEGLP